MSEWRDEINRRALARLNAALPEVFPQPALIHALRRRFTPPMPRLAIDSYWRGHPPPAPRSPPAPSGGRGGPPPRRWWAAPRQTPRRHPPPPPSRGANARVAVRG